MNFNDFCWADSDLENIYIEYDRACIMIWNDVLQKRFAVECVGFAGITNLCIWDDTIIKNAAILKADESDGEFVHTIYTAYKKEINYGGRFLSSGLLELRIEIVNNISFSIYCLNIDVKEVQ